MKTRIPFENSKFEKVRIRFLISEKTKSKIQVGDAKPKDEAKYPFFTSGENILSFDEFLCDNQTIFLNTGGNASVKFYDGKASYSTDTYAIKSKNENFYLTKFLFYCLNDTKFMNDIYFEGSALKHLQKNKFKNFKIPLPPLNEQKKIAEFLDKKCEIIDKRLSNLERKIKSLKEYKKSLISECVTKGLNPKNREFKDSQISWIGQIPKHWEIKKLKYIATKIYKGNGITKEQVFENGDMPCVRYGEIYTKYNYSFDECFSYTFEKVLNSTSYFGYGDILFTCTGELIEEIGKNVVYLGHKKCLAGGDIIILNHKQNPSFLNYALDIAIMLEIKKAMVKQN